MADPTFPVFISYAHADDQPFEEGARGWVTHFVDGLQKALRQKTGDSQIQCWMDHRLEPQRSVNSELRRRIEESRCILAFMSPSYLKSPWCAQEMDTFIQLVGGGSANDRVFVAELLPTERKRWHPGACNLTGETFWSSSLERPEEKILGWPLPSIKGDPAYWDKLNTLAAILARQIQALPAEPATPPAPAPAAAAFATAKLPDAGPPRVFIEADRPDRDLGKRVQDLLGELEVEATLVAESVPSQDPAEYRRDWESQLQDSHGVLIVYGAAPPSWVQAKYAAARKVLAWQRQGCWSALLDGPPEGKPDHGLPSRNLLLLNCRQGIGSADLLQPFVDSLRQGAGHV